MNKYDIVILGAGAAGLIGARFAAKLGAKVALVDRSRIGGDCTWTGCIPSKSLIHIAKIAHESKNAGKIGVQCGPVSVDWAQVTAYLDSKIDDVYAHTTPELLTSEGIDVVQGETKFISSETLEVEGHGQYHSSNFLICVGADPIVPPISGLSEIPYLTYLNIFSQKEQPKSLIIIGAGPIGLEMAQSFARLGTQVTVVGMGFLVKEEPGARDLLMAKLKGEGIDIRQGSVSQVGKCDVGVYATVDDTRIEAEKILVSTGRKPRLEGLALESAGVAYTAKGISVDNTLRTSVKHIYAAGDCIGSYQFSHFAGWQGWQAVRTALLPGSGSGVAEVLPWCTFTDPEVARVGPLESEARETYGEKLQVHRLDLRDVDRAICDGDEGFIQLLHVGTKIIGATVVASHAGETINEIALAMKQGIGLEKLAGTIHAYPTYSTALQLMATDIATESFVTGWMGKLAFKLSGLTPKPNQS